jgi:hypothetical protein
MKTLSIFIACSFIVLSVSAQYHSKRQNNNNGRQLKKSSPALDRRVLLCFEDMSKEIRA